MTEPEYPTVMLVFDMLRLLRRRGARGMAVNELADALGKSHRTVVRYVKALAACVDDERGRPLVRREQRDGTVWAVMSTPAAPLTASIYQYAAVFAATRHFPEGSLLGETAGGVLDQLGESEALPRDVVARVLAGFCYVPFGPKDYTEVAETLDVIVRGIVFRRPIDVVYRSLHRGSEVGRPRVLEPWTLVMYRDGLYLLARDASAEPQHSPYLYAIERMEEARLRRSESFELPAGFRPDDFFAKGLGLWQTDEPAETVRLAFSSGAATLAKERRWPGFIRWEALAERHVLALEVPVTPEVISWVTGWGPDVEVLAPESFRQQVAAAHRNALRYYE